MTRLLAAAGLVAALLVPTAATGATTGRVFRLTDPRIVEASSLVDLGPRMVTANDSGNAPDLFSVDARTGQDRRSHPPAGACGGHRGARASGRRPRLGR